MSDRNPRFSAWDIKTNKMIFEGFHVIGEVTCFSMMNQYIDENPCGAKSSIDRWDDIKLMECTELKDKNGKLIYEKYKVKTPRGIGIIEYSEGRYIIEYGEKTIDELFYFHIDAYNMIEIIGHEYELTKE